MSHFKRLKKTLINKTLDGRYIPTTFDETMVEFGYRLKRKNLLARINDSLVRLEQAMREQTKIEGICSDFCKAFEELIDVENPKTKYLESTANKLYRRIYTRAVESR